MSDQHPAVAFLLAAHERAVTSAKQRVAAERDILTEHAPGNPDVEDRDETECRTCSGPTPGFSGSWPMAWPCRTMLLLASAWGWEQQGGEQP